MENVGLFKQFSMDCYIVDLNNSIHDILEAKDDCKIMKEIGYIASESVKALYAYKRNCKDNEIIFHAVATVINEIAKELRENDLHLAAMLGE